MEEMYPCSENLLKRTLIFAFVVVLIFTFGTQFQLSDDIKLYATLIGGLLPNISGFIMCGENTKSTNKFNSPYLINEIDKLLEEWSRNNNDENNIVIRDPVRRGSSTSDGGILVI